MLKRRSTAARLARSAQQGMVLLVAIVVLVALMVTGIAMMRSVDTATLVTGNVAFQQAATYAADKGIEDAIAMLRKKLADGKLNENEPEAGYFATMTAEQSPETDQSWQDFWQKKLEPNVYHANLADKFGNEVYYVVHRMCQFAQPPGTGGKCVASPAVSKSTGNSQEAGEIQLNSASQIYYRITVRVLGPRRTESYVQAHVAM